MHLKLGPLGPGLKLHYRFMFLPTAWITQGLQSVFTIITPIMFLLLGLVPMTGVDVNALIYYLVPALIALVGGITLLAPRLYYPLAAQILGMFQTFRILPVALQALFRPKGLIFKVTPKGANAGSESWQKAILIAAITLIGLTAAGIAINMSPDHRIVEDGSLVGAVAFWSAINMILLLLVAMMCLERPRMRGEERFPIIQPVSILGERGAIVTSSRGDISLSGLGLDIAATGDFTIGERVQVVVPDVGIVRGIVRRADRRIGVAFDFQSEQLRDRLIVALFTGRMINTGERPSTLSVALAMLQRLWSARLDVAPAPVAFPSAEMVETRLSPATRVFPPAPKITPVQQDDIALLPQRLSKTG
ncbi:hypothetical protein ASG67_10800 [Sphingomonas sp. Leaf339]|uniref:PilZ domain-containing protein n=1 Tax=Sphingomonas sp. Leaf339 TaxID=1736343 RepID=UPI0007022A34|nr:PilZ domain-containing protein [Sphingomonas sp. Leaf339]KQU49614.1 hypothetical protein ASG67_10800 [Sphingomonas sp. Leaf339]